MTRAPATRRTRTGLTFEGIVDAASGLVVEGGFEALSMRALAERCGVGVMTLYGHVRTKEELLAALAERAFAELELPDADELVWQEQIAQVFRSVRRMFLEHPELVAIVSFQRMDGIAAYRGAELVLGALRQAGLEDRDVVSAFNALSAFTIGSAEREIGTRTPTAAALPGVRALSAPEFAHVIELAGLLATPDHEHDFEVGLDLIIRGVTNSVQEGGD